MAEIWVGLGIDLHRADPGRPLSLGGVRFDGEPGLAGHSDGDVICHALADALLGATGLGDLGERFPDSDPAWAGIAGLDLLARAVRLVHDAGFAPDGFDLTFVAERPLIGGRRDEIRTNLAGALGIPASRASVKATRPEGLGWSGDGAGCLAVVTVAVRESG
jgi:2-C-methyl-D-erythritol 2,4-cyclodiphosphate synthase